MALTEVDVARLNDDVFAATGTNKNRIINGDMRIDQRNAGAAVTSPSGGTSYVMDRWLIARFNDTTGTFTCAQNSTAPVGFTNSALITVTAPQSSVPSNAVYRFSQSIEGFNVADMGWGTANAQTITVSFWVRSSITGTYGGRIRNSANSRSYVFQYTINNANTFEYKTITIPGDTSGTWLTNNGIGLSIEFGLGDGSGFQGTANAWQAGEFTFASGNVQLINTNGATFYITGVQLESGDTATPFERRNYGDEELKCMRYYQRFGNAIANPAGEDDGFMTFANYSATAAYGGQKFTVPMRTRPTMVAAGCSYYSNGIIDNSLNVDMIGASTNYGEIRVTGFSVTQGYAGWLRIEQAGAYIEFNAEL